MSDSFNIVKIIDEYQVIINAGLNHQIEKGDNFRILDTEGEPVNDPKTDEVIGYLSHVKDYVTAKEVFDKMTICESVKDVNFHFLAHSSTPFKYMDRKRLNVDMTKITGGDKSSDKKITIGDEVQKIN